MSQNLKSEGQYIVNKFLDLTYGVTGDSIMTGGDLDEKGNFPNGGFLPIIVCSKKDEKEKENKNREFKNKKDNISIKDILQSRRDKNEPLF